MAYDEDFAGRVRELISAEVGVTERPMFGGLAFLVDGRMAIAVRGRRWADGASRPQPARPAVCSPHTQPFEMRGVEMKSWLRVGGEGLRTNRPASSSSPSPATESAP